jgi:hypothetical protein
MNREKLVQALETARVYILDAYNCVHEGKIEEGKFHLIKAYVLLGHAIINLKEVEACKK